MPTAALERSAAASPAPPFAAHRGAPSAPRQQWQQHEHGLGLGRIRLGLRWTAVAAAVLFLAAASTATAAAAARGRGRLCRRLKPAREIRVCRCERRVGGDLWSGALSKHTNQTVGADPLCCALLCAHCAAVISSLITGEVSPTVC